MTVKGRPVLLAVDDSGDLLALMRKVLSADYVMLTAKMPRSRSRSVPGAGAVAAAALAMTYFMPATKVPAREPSFELKLDTGLHSYQS